MEIRPGRPDPETPLPLPQHPAQARTLAAMGRETLSLRVGTGSALLMTRAVGPFGHVALAARGPVWGPEADPGARLAALGALSAHGLRMVEADGPDEAAPLRAAGFIRVMTPAHVAELDLACGPYALRARLSQKWRNRLHAAERSGLRVTAEPFRPDADHWLLAREAEQARAKRYGRLPSAIALAFAAANPGAATLFVGWSRAAPVAAMLILRHGPVATYQLGWSGALGRRLSAHHLILVTAADALARDGVRRLDLGQVDTEGGPGLARFKIGTGAAIRPLGGSWLRLPGAAALAKRRARG